VARKFLERIPGTKTRLYQFTAIDDCTRIRVLEVYPTYAIASDRPRSVVSPVEQGRCQRRHPPYGTRKCANGRTTTPTAGRTAESVARAICTNQKSHRISSRPRLFAHV